MAIINFSTFSLYRWRYIIGYGVVGLTLAGLLIFAGLFLPGGLSTTEQAEVVRSGSLHLTDPSSFARINLPYSVLQAASISIFGVSDFSIKLPSLILALASAIGIIFLLRRWFSHNIAVLGSFIAITTGQFLFVAQYGTPAILYIFWPTMLLLLATLITRGKSHLFIWKSLFFITAALSLYTPLSIYPLIAMAIAVILHPHLRHIFRVMSKWRLSIAIVIGLIILSPLIYGIIQDPRLGLTLLGVPAEFPNFWENFKLLINQYLDFWNVSTTALMTPVFGLGSFLLILFGLYRTIRTRETTQSYLVIIWLICLVPVLLINPLFTTVTFVPLVLLLTTGLQGLTSYWYRLFPRNPYARVLGLMPLIVLVVALVISGLDRYAYGYYYQPATVANFNHDLSLMPEKMERLVVSDDELEFYKVVERHRDGLTVSTEPAGPLFVSTRAAHQTFEGYEVSSIITSGMSQEADRFYLYKKVQE